MHHGSPGKPGAESRAVLKARLPLPQGIMGSPGRTASSALMTAAHTAAMTNTFKSGVRHAGWLHKLVGKTPQDTNWRRYWVSARGGGGWGGGARRLCMVEATRREVSQARVHRRSVNVAQGLCCLLCWAS